MVYKTWSFLCQKNMSYYRWYAVSDFCGGFGDTAATLYTGLELIHRHLNIITVGDTICGLPWTIFVGSYDA